jgi:hypothetical protein
MLVYCKNAFSSINIALLVAVHMPLTHVTTAVDCDLVALLTFHTIIVYNST